MEQGELAAPGGQLPAAPGLCERPSVSAEAPARPTAGQRCAGQPRRDRRSPLPGLREHESHRRRLCRGATCGPAGRGQRSRDRARGGAGKRRGRTREAVERRVRPLPHSLRPRCRAGAPGYRAGPASGRGSCASGRARGRPQGPAPDGRVPSTPNSTATSAPSASPPDVTQRLNSRTKGQRGHRVTS